MDDFRAFSHYAADSEMYVLCMDKFKFCAVG